MYDRSPRTRRLQSQLSPDPLSGDVLSEHSPSLHSSESVLCGTHEPGAHVSCRNDRPSPSICTRQPCVFHHNGNSPFVADPVWLWLSAFVLIALSLADL